MIKLGDCRVLETQKPQLMERLLKLADLKDPIFQAPEFHNAMKNARKGTFETLTLLLDKIEKAKTSTKEAILGEEPFLSKELPLKVVDNIIRLVGHLGPEAIEKGLQIARDTRSRINELFAESGIINLKLN
ncbi:MAG: hypothetical protein UR28_C0039G0037 [Candidatus Peregrinibacteria bacterium GW2011_GWF2_33_10]|nr:MAG: hypothetical protein UR28_C0039G0037 [Candidatus Peregrinibacteria bacterium GW2011_GWF2_33_10]OGJ45940.1 MAG: hypothetical protein A2263_02265 [Candidatus Peregrinibacteria bacterium RIFOXYA2_FULL_33_21]OGJ46618.1 MAG: hypothetical protein A2272_02935 [Candidatus Peregrinibacteria bacterium RIFOXYA12_FULL_33_12]OGJ51530.1 MAG: hypothetical protein A2307_01050 [Candidatus Peregrinibacteria bacterium RIFOXYB2_FULL_33_20]